ncbi:hypothetical protein [Myxococcus phage Mx4 ts27htf-1hrm-1]|nr:hypothetical protein Mx4_p61 [Myxococcus phage Mx4]WNM70400.1 hypothetical protein [Myxococcus phage Mx4 ts27htf-1hrm-1]
MTAWCEVAGLPALAGVVHLPRVGAWVADLHLDADAPPGGRVDVVLGAGALRLTGTVLPGATGATGGSARVRVVGGGGGLRRPLPAAGYRNVPLSVPLRAALSEAGETLAPEADAAALATFLPRWARLAGTAGSTVAALAAQVRLPWRVLPSGALWLGPERWAQAAGEYEVLEELPQQQAVLVASDAPRVLPGQAFLGRPVGHVAHHFSADSLRVLVTFEATS